MKLQFDTLILNFEIAYPHNLYLTLHMPLFEELLVDIGEQLPGCLLL